MRSPSSNGIVLKLARRRRSIRRYKRTPISLNKVLYAIMAALEAPSGANRQPWRFIIVDDPELKARIRAECEYWEKRFYESPHLPAWFREWASSRGITWKKEFLTDAPYLIAVASYRKAPHSRESTWLAIGYLLLALEEVGLASLTYTPSNPLAVARILGIPDDYTLETIIPVGEPADDKRKEPRLSLSQAVYYNLWDRTVALKTELKA